MVKTVSNNVQMLDNDVFITSVDTLTKSDIAAILSKHDELVNSKYQPLMNYYLGNHPILHKDDDPYSTENNKIVDNLPKKLVSTFNGYFTGKAPSILLEESGVNELLQDWNHSNSLTDKLSENSKLVDIYGRAYFFVYQNKDGETRVTVTSPVDSVMVYDNLVEQKPVAFIRCWNDSKQLEHALIYYADGVQEYSKDDLVDSDEGNIYGFVPAVEFYAEEERQGLYETELSAFDALDDLLSQKQNNIDYFANAYMYLIGGKISDQDMIKMKKQRLINAVSANAVNAKIGFLERPDADNMEEHQLQHLTELIHNNTSIPDMSDEHFAGNASGVAIKYKLQPMEDKAGTKERKFTYALKNLYRIVFAKNTKVNIPEDMWQDVQFHFIRNLPANLADEADTANKLQGLVSDETVLKTLSIVNDPKEEIKQREKESEERVKNAMQFTQPDSMKLEDDDGEVDE